MSIALSEFWTRLVRSGIADAEGCRKLAAAFAKANSGTPASDPQAVARFMVKRGKLTKFQARALLATPPRELRAGSFVIRSDQTAAPFSRWLEASRIDDGSQGLLLHARISAESEGLREILNRHMLANSATLQPLEPEFHSGAVLLFAPLASGRCLIESIRDHQALPAAEVCRIGIAVASALEMLHKSSLIHGQVRADRVWISEHGQPILLRDPSIMDASTSQENWLDSLESDAFYSAPELPGHGQAASVATDIYSLGCLLFRLVTGRLPFQGVTDAETRAAHLNETPPELSDAVNRGESGDPLLRVIAFAMAKNPASRFASAQQLSAALQAVVNLLDRKHQIDIEVQAGQSVDTVREPSLKQTAAEGSTTSSNTKSNLNSETDVKKSIEIADNENSIPSSGDKKLESRAAAASRREPQEPADRKAVQEGGEEKSRADAKPRRKGRKSGEARSERNQAKAESLAGHDAVSTAIPETVAVPASGSNLGTDTDIAAQRKVPVVEPPTSVSATHPAPPIATPELNLAPATSTDEGDAIASPETERTSGREPSLRRRRKKKSTAPLVLGALCVAVLMLMIGLIARDDTEPEPRKSPRRPLPSEVPPVSSRPIVTSPAAATGTSPESGLGYELVSDERLLFVPPYPADSPIPPLELLPPGPAVIVTARLAQIAGDPTGSILIDGISPELSDLLGRAAVRAKASRAAIRRLSIALHPGAEGWPEVSLVVELNESIAKADLMDRLEVDAARTTEGVTIYVGEQEGSDAFYWIETDDDLVSQFAVGSVERISEVAAAEGGSIPLPRSAQSLWDRTSEESALVVLFTPNFLFADGRELLSASAPELTRPLRRLMQPDVAAAVISVNLSDEESVFVEAMFAPSGGISEAALMRKVADTIKSWPQWADRFILESVPDPSWRLLASRLPSMMRFVVGQARFGVSDGRVVVNAYLPSNAFPQVTLATVLAMNTQTSATTSPTTSPTVAPLTVDQMLDREMSVSFDQESLEFALDAIVNAFKDSLPPGSTMPPARIIGGDLQLMGITQNQQVRDFAKTQLPLRTVLTDLVLGANPDKSATGPGDPKQSLIWVVADDPNNAGQKEILITTRQAANSKKYEVPREFAIETPAEQ